MTSILDRFTGTAEPEETRVTITISHGTEPGGPLAAVLALDHRGALTAAASILHKAGVERAEFEGTRIQEMTRP